MKKFLCILSLSAAVTATQAAINIGDVLVIDVGLDAGPTAGNWNNISSSTGGDAAPDITDAIRLSDGAATGVGLRILAQENGKAGIGGATVGAPATTAGLSFTGSGAIPTTAIQDVGYMSQEDLGSSADSTNGFVFSNLDDSLTYTLSWVTSINAARSTLDWTVGGNTIAIDPQDNATVYSFSGLLTDGSGNLLVSIDISQVNNDDTAHINAIELVAVPEPSTIALLLGLGALGFVFLRRRS